MSTLYEQYLELNKTNQVKMNYHSVLPICSVKYLINVSDWQNELILMARGLVIDTDGNIIARPYKKFFGLNQLDYMLLDEQSTQEQIEFVERLKKKDLLLSEEFIHQMCHYQSDEEIDVVLDKLDGSLMIVSTYRNQLMAFSSGSTESRYSDMMMNALNKHISESGISKEELTDFCKMYTLCFEFIDSELDAHVIDYSEKGIFLHGVVHTQSGEELNWKEVKEVADRFKFKRVKELPFHTFEEISYQLNAIENHEGFVIRFKDGTKLKMKSDDYIEKHSNMSILYSNKLTKRIVSSLVTIVINSEEDDIYSHCQKVVQDEIKRIQSDLIQYKESLDKLSKEIVSIHDNNKEIKEFAKEYIKYSKENEIGQIDVRVFKLVKSSKCDEKEIYHILEESTELILKDRALKHLRKIKAMY